jgi:hypothetical protein
MNPRRFMLALPSAIIAAQIAVREEVAATAMTHGQGAGGRQNQVVMDKAVT